MESCYKENIIFIFYPNFSLLSCDFVLLWLWMEKKILTLFLNTILRLFPLVAKALAAVIYLCLVGLILALFLRTGPAKLALPLFFVRSGMLPLLSLASFSPPGQLCFNEHVLHIISPLLPFLHMVEFVVLHNSHVGLLPNGIFA